jgi:hypothetical protein
VLENDAAVDEPKISITKTIQTVSLVYQELTMIRRFIELPCQTNHGGRNVHAPALLKMSAQSPGQATNSTAEIQSRRLGLYTGTQRTKVSQDLLNFSFAGRKKILLVPSIMTPLGIGTNAPQGVGLRIGFKCIQQLLQ